MCQVHDQVFQGRRPSDDLHVDRAGKKGLRQLHFNLLEQIVAADPANEIREML